MRLEFSQGAEDQSRGSHLNDLLKDPWQRQVLGWWLAGLAGLAALVGLGEVREVSTAWNSRRERFSHLEMVCSVDGGGEQAENCWRQVEGQARGQGRPDSPTHRGGKHQSCLKAACRCAEGLGSKACERSCEDW